MLPTPEYLREPSRRCRDAARLTVDAAVKRTLAAYASILAQVAEAIERDDEPARQAKAEGHERLIAQALRERTGDIFRHEITGQQRQTAVDPHSQIRAWRLRAVELRTASDQFSVPSAQETLRRQDGGQRPSAAGRASGANHQGRLSAARRPARLRRCPFRKRADHSLALLVQQRQQLLVGREYLSRQERVMAIALQLGDDLTLVLDMRPCLGHATLGMRQSALQHVAVHGPPLTAVATLILA
jgi:hypothetical protein